MRTNKEQLLQFETYEFIKQITIDTHTNYTAVKKINRNTIMSVRMLKVYEVACFTFKLVKEMSVLKVLCLHDNRITGNFFGI